MTIPKCTVTVLAGQGEYKVKCKDKKDLDKYLKSLKENEPYFHLVGVKNETGKNCRVT